MLKKMLIVSIVFLAVVSFSKPAGATFSWYQDFGGYYRVVAGKVNLDVNFPNYFTLKIGLPNLANISEMLEGYLIFYHWVDQYGDPLYYDFGPFGFYLPIMNDLSGIIPPITLSDQAQPLQEESVEPPIVGEWQVTGSTKFAIVPADENGEYVDIEQTINDLLQTQDFPINMITVDVTKYSFTGSVNKDTSLKTNLSIGIRINAYVTTGTINLTGSFTTATPVYTFPESLGIQSASDRSLKVSSQGLASWIVNIVKGLPLKNAIPSK